MSRQIEIIKEQLANLGDAEEVGVVGTVEQIEQAINELCLDDRSFVIQETIKEGYAYAVCCYYEIEPGMNIVERIMVGLGFVFFGLWVLQALTGWWV